ncbi:MAG: hypothetical protein HZC37_28160 [Burkholderiales bacterium]|nr:hypothetical protein [Burkholderiales bacterium]
MSSAIDPTCTGIDLERAAFNAAFYELGLRWHWDEETYDGLRALPGEREQVQRYLQTRQAHLLRAYDAAFLTDAILETKARCLLALANCHGHPARAGFDWTRWADPRWGEVGI